MWPLQPGSGWCGLAMKLGMMPKREPISLVPVLKRMARSACSSASLKPMAAGLSSSAGRLVAGGVADVCVFDPAHRWQVLPDALVSQGKHTPFAFESTGFEMAGKVCLTLVAGQVAHEGA